MINFDDVTKTPQKNIIQIGHKFLVIHMKYQQPDIDKIYVYAKDQYEAKYELLINKQERTG